MQDPQPVFSGSRDHHPDAEDSGSHISVIKAWTEAMSAISGADVPLCGRGIALFTELTSGKWKILILLELMRTAKGMRFTQILELFYPISRKVLTEQLRDMEWHGLIKRNTFYTEEGLNIDYCLTEIGWSLHPVFMMMNLWGLRYG